MCKVCAAAFLMRKAVLQCIELQMTWGNQNTEKEAHEQLSYAFDNGINIFDSAEAVSF